MKMSKMVVQAVVLGMCLVFSAGVAGAVGDRPVRELLVLGVGDSQTREFEIYDVFNINGLEPAEGYAIIATGSADVPAGDLGIALSTSVEKEFGETMEYAIIGLGFSTAGPIVIYEKATTPNSAAATATINGTFGVLYVGAIITDVSSGNNVYLPAEFKLTVSLAAQETE